MEDTKWEAMREEFMKKWNDTFIAGRGPYWPDVDGIADFWLSKFSDLKQKVEGLKVKKPRTIAGHSYNTALTDVLELLK